MMKKAIIFAGGTISGVNIVNNLQEFDVICVDKGLDFAIKNNMNIKIAIGDFDSASEESLDYIQTNNIDLLKFHKDKDMTDLELSLVYCKENKYELIYVFGAIGTRMDHTLSNIFLLKTYTSINRKITLVDKNNYIYYLDKNEEVFNNNKFNNISILPTNEDAIINLIGTKWELYEHELKFGSSLTVSNEFLININPKIEILKGNIFVILSKD